MSTWIFTFNCLNWRKIQFLKYGFCLTKLFIISVISCLFSTMPSKKAKWRKKFDKENEPKTAQYDSKGKLKSRLFCSVYRAKNNLPYEALCLNLVKPFNSLMILLYSKLESMPVGRGCHKLMQIILKHIYSTLPEYSICEIILHYKSNSSPFVFVESVSYDPNYMDIV